MLEKGRKAGDSSSSPSSSSPSASCCVAAFVEVKRGRCLNAWLLEICSAGSESDVDVSDELSDLAEGEVAPCSLRGTLVSDIVVPDWSCVSASLVAAVFSRSW